jgi:hypothetical protein
MISWIIDFIYRLKKFRNVEWAIICSTLLGLILAGLLIWFVGGAVAGIFSLGTSLPYWFGITLGGLSLVYSIASISTSIGVSFDRLLMERTVPGLILDGIKTIYSYCTTSQSNIKQVDNPNNTISVSSYMKTQELKPNLSATAIPQNKMITNTLIYTGLGLLFGLGISGAAVGLVVSGILSGGTAPAIMMGLGMVGGGALTILAFTAGTTSFLRYHGQVLDRMYDNRTIFDWCYDKLTNTNGTKKEMENSFQKALNKKSHTYKIVTESLTNKKNNYSSLTEELVSKNTTQITLEMPIKQPSNNLNKNNTTTTYKLSNSSNKFNYSKSKINNDLSESNIDENPNLLVL